MEIINLSVKELYNKLNNKEITSYDIYNAYLKNINEKDDKLGAFLSVNKFKDSNELSSEEIDEYNSKYKLPIGIKDNIAVKGLPLTASSKILKDYISPYDASFIEQLKDSGIYIMGKLNLDEFAIGFSTQNSELKKTLNPLDLSRIPGGSSGGSATSVSGNLLPWSIGTDTGGSIRQPASFTKTVGFKPSYGLISRYGVISVASSLDHIGMITKTVEDSAVLLNLISVKNENDKDPNTIVLEKDYTTSLNEGIKDLKIGYIQELIDDSSDIVKEEMNKSIEFFKENGAILENVEIPYLEYLSAIYTITNSAVASSNLSRFDGVRYGNRIDSESYEEMVKKTRTEGFGLEVKKRIILGSYFLGEENYNKYYIKAAQLRRLLVEELNKIFVEYDAIIMPTTQNIAPRIDELEEVNTELLDKYTVLANLSGIPAISIPMKSEKAIGMQIMSKSFNDELVLRIANFYEKNK